MSASETWRCGGCGKPLGEFVADSYVMRHDNRCLVVTSGVVIVVTCDRCRRTNRHEPADRAPVLVHTATANGGAGE